MKHLHTFESHYDRHTLKIEDVELLKDIFQNLTDELSLELKYFSSINGITLNGPDGEFYIRFLLDDFDGVPIERIKFTQELNRAQRKMGANYSIGFKMTFTVNSYPGKVFYVNDLKDSIINDKIINIQTFALTLSSK